MVYRRRLQTVSRLKKTNSFFADVDIAYCRSELEGEGGGEADQIELTEGGWRFRGGQSTWLGSVESLDVQDSPFHLRYFDTSSEIWCMTHVTTRASST